MKNKLIDKVKYAGTCASVALATAMSQIGVHAAGGDTSKLSETVMGICDLVVSIFPFIGGFFIIAGAMKLFLAYRNDQPEAQTTAAKDLVIGAVFVAFRVFAWPVLKTLI